MVKLVDTPALGAGARKSLGVRVPPPASRHRVSASARALRSRALWGSGQIGQRLRSPKPAIPGSSPGCPANPPSAHVPAPPRPAAERRAHRLRLRSSLRRVLEVGGRSCRMQGHGDRAQDDHDRNRIRDAGAAAGRGDRAHQRVGSPVPRCRPGTIEAEPASSAQRRSLPVNKERRSRAPGSLHRQSGQMKAARKHTKRMIRGRCFSHQCPGEQDLTNRLVQADYLPCSCSWGIAENIAYGSGRLERLAADDRHRLDAQLRAPGEHPQRSYEHIGVAVASGTPRPDATADAATYTPTSDTGAERQLTVGACRPPSPPFQLTPRHPDGRDLGDRPRDGAARRGRAAAARDRAAHRGRRRGSRPRARRLRDPDPVHLHPRRPARRPDRPPPAAARRPRAHRPRLDPDRGLRSVARRCWSGGRPGRSAPL